MSKLNYDLQGSWNGSTPSHPVVIDDHDFVSKPMGFMQDWSS